MTLENSLKTKVGNRFPVNCVGEKKRKGKKKKEEEKEEISKGESQGSRNFWKEDPGRKTALLLIQAILEPMV